MKEQKKKRLIAVLLLISCVISAYMLFAASGGASKQLQSLARADSLIQKELSEFNISDNQVQTSTIRVDSNFSRKIYHIALPYRFSKTQFHAELNSTLHEYGIETPGQVTFPEKNIDIHLLYRNTVIRSLSLQTDPKLQLNRNEISLLVTFERLPDEQLLSKLSDLGEPIPIVLKIENPFQANHIRKQLNGRYSRIMFWLQNSDGEDLMKTNPESALSKLNQIEDVLPKARLLQFNHTDPMHRRLMSKTNLTFINTTHAILLDEDTGRKSFVEKLRKMGTNTNPSIAVIKGNETTISWLVEKLPELKKMGITIAPPPQSNY